VGELVTQKTPSFVIRRNSGAKNNGAKVSALVLAAQMSAHQ